MNLKLPLAFLLITTGSVFADQAADRANLAGKWENTSGDGSSWVIEQKSDGVHMTYTEKGQTSDVDCNTMGRQCDLKTGGKDDKVSMYFSGPKLVEIETKGKDVVKRRFTAPGGSDVLEVEVMPIVPAGKPETLKFHRAQVSAAARPAGQQPAQ